MSVEVKMPDLGTTVESVVLLKWLKQVGEAVKRGEPLCEVQTDKANTELESVAKGTLLKQVIAENTEIPVGTVIAYIGEPGENIPE
mgnify:CR=1 FL=1|jgi:pyruvate/2-oxoglutarate dehydrogenase complex dihydrolipoamide acyltransferase (E2) component